MTKTTKAMLAGAALAGLIAGTGAAVNASTLLSFAEDVLQRPGSGAGQGQEGRQAGQRKACLQGPELLQG